MSYILDALRKAEAEREVAGKTSDVRGMGIHAPAAPPGPEIRDEAAFAAGGGMAPLVWWSAGLGGLVAVGVFAWWLAGRPADTEPVQATVLAQQVRAPVAQPQPPPLVLPPADPISPTAPDEVAPVTPPAPWAGEDAAPSRRPSKTPSKAPDRESPKASARPSPVTAPAADRIYALHELPDSIRRQLPQLSVGGAMYSDNAASRMLILNGQPFHEGSQPVSHLKLEQINLKSAVLSYKGYRYRIDY